MNAMPDAPGLPFLAWCSETVSDAGDMGLVERSDLEKNLMQTSIYIYIYLIKTISNHNIKFDKLNDASVGWSLQ